MMRAGVGILVFLCGGLCVVGDAYGETPVASFTAESTSGGGALTVWFRDTSNTGTLESGSWLWDFGDGSTDTPEATLQHPAHYYEYPGTYSVSLTVTTDDGVDTFTQTDLVTVNTVPIFRVDENNTSELETGLTWPNAFNTIQEGVDAAARRRRRGLGGTRRTNDNVNAARRCARRRRRLLRRVDERQCCPLRRLQRNRGIAPSRDPKSAHGH